MRCNTIILKCFIQFSCTNLDGSKKEGVTFLVCFRKRGLPRKGGGFPQKSRGPNPGGNYVILQITSPGRSFMYSRKSGGPRMDPYRTPALTGYYCDNFLFTTRSFLLLTLRKEEIRPNV